MPAHPIFDDLKAVSFKLDADSRDQLVALARAKKSNRSAIVRYLIGQAYDDFFRSRLHQSEEFSLVNRPSADSK
jgi:hypothetical protein